MEGESVRVGCHGQSFTTETSSILNVHILVVDDDATSLAVVSAMLRTLRYGVVTVRNAIDALATLRVQKFDLVVTDLHMPEMNGLELQKRVEEEFKLPVIMMSADDENSVIVDSLQRGVAFYMVKPVSPDDLKHVWQYAVPSKKGKHVVIEEIRSIPEESTGEKVSFEDINSASSFLVNEEKRGKKDSKRKAPKKANEDEEEENLAAPKKAKVVWTTSLHNQFLQAIRHLSLEKAVPKRILEFMNVPGLTRENVASHLQKYRIFLKRVADKCGGTSKSLSDRSLRSSFSYGLPSLLLQNFQFPQHQQQMRTSSFRPGLGGGTTRAFNTPTLGPFLLSNKAAASSGSSLPQLGHGMWHSLRNQANLQQQPLFGNTNPLYPANQPNNLGSNFPSLGNMPNGIMNATNGTNSIQTCPSSSYSKGNYAGIEISSGGELVIKCPSSFNGGVENDVNNTSYGLMNGHNAVMENWASSTGFESINQWPQENAWLIPPQPQANQQYNTVAKEGESTDCEFDDLLNNICTLINDIPRVQQLGEDDDLSDLFLEQSHNQTLDQCEAEVNPIVNELQNPDISSSSCVEDNAPSSKPSFVKHGNDKELVDSGELYDMMYQVENTPSEGHDLFLNQEWEDEFIDPLIFGHVPYPKE